MIDLRKNDIIDAVFKRYKDSYKLTENTPDYMQKRDIDWYDAILRRNMRKDIKKIDREFRKFKRREFRARVWAWFKKLLKKLFPWFAKKAEPSAPVEPSELQTPPQSDITPAQSDAPEASDKTILPDAPDETIIIDAPAEAERDGTSEIRRAERSEDATPRRDTSAKTLSPRDPAPISPDTTFNQDTSFTSAELLELDKCEADNELPETDKQEPDDECPII